MSSLKTDGVLKGQQKTCNVLSIITLKQETANCTGKRKSPKFLARRENVCQTLEAEADMIFKTENWTMTSLGLKIGR